LNRKVAPFELNMMSCPSEFNGINCGRKAFFESERTIRKNSHYYFCVKYNHSPEMPEGLIALSNRPFRFGKKTKS